ncbi:MAG TPA: sugar phosphate nucleotidyltransferase [Solirubrobacteraceae bacterium]|nr:sugar phosphate nucleotidyltransferase [Solirubrobacteraceae bacterium]
MNRTRTLVVVLAGGAGGRLELLTHERAKPAVSFAGTHRLIDFPLSNCRNAGLSDVWVVQQFNPISLSDHLANGRPWDLDRTSGGLLTLQPRMGHDGRDGFPKGTADALWRNAPMIREFAPDALVVVSADAVYALDYAAVVAEHAASDAAVTMVTTEVAPGDAGRYGVVQLDGERVTEYVYKPDEPATSTISNEVFVFSPRELLDRLDALAKDSDELEDLGNALLPGLVEDGRVRAHRFDGYWRDVGTIDAFHSAHMEQLEHPPPIALDDPAWPVLTHAAARRATARVLAGASVEQSLLAAAARVGGSVERSVIGRGALVEEGAVVRDSIVLPGAVVRAGATVERAILDDLVEVERGVTVGKADGDIALVGLRAHVEEDLPAGARFPEVD